jgi:mannan endo-1,4-beta-mannosidase
MPPRRSRRVLPAVALLLVGTLASAHIGSPGRAAEDASRRGLTTFVTRAHDKLHEGDQEFRFVSVNLPDILQVITNNVFDGDRETRLRLPDEFELRDGVRTVRQLGGRVLRTFVITCRQEPHPAYMFAVGGGRVEPNEDALRVFDRLLQICHEERVRVLVPLVAYNSPWRGDWRTYGEDFWQVGSAGNRKFKRMLELLLGRTNTLTGVPYRDDPAILGWQTGNELVIGDSAERRAWLHDIAAFLKRLAPNHLAIDGRNKPADLWGSYDEFAADPNIDAVSYHTYVNLPHADTPAGTLRLLREMTRGKIPLLITEIAMYTSPAALRRLLDELLANGTAGAQWWSVRFHNRDGGFYKHSDRNSQFEDLNWPGFADPNNFLPEVTRERELLTVVAEYAARIQGRSRATPIERPVPPVMLPARDVGHLSWRGSTGAHAYELQRATSPEGPWQTLQRDATDHLVVCAPLYCDTTAEESRSYFYRTIARSDAGDSAPSNTIGPIVVDRCWFVDELFDLSRANIATHNIRVAKSYAHSAYLEDIAVAVRDALDAPAVLAYRVPGALRFFTCTVFDAGVSPQFFVRRAGDKSRTEVTPTVTRYDEGRRARYTAELDSDAGDTLEIALSAEASPRQAIGRVELAFTGH